MPMRRVALPLSIVVAAIALGGIAAQVRTCEGEDVCLRCGARRSVREMSFAGAAIERTHTVLETAWSRAVVRLVGPHEHAWFTLWSRKRSAWDGQNEEDSVAHVLLPRILDHPGGIARVWEADDHLGSHFLCLYCGTRASWEPPG